MHFYLILSQPCSSLAVPKVGPICFGDLSPARRSRISTPFPCQYFAISLCRSIYHCAVGLSWYRVFVLSEWPRPGFSSLPWTLIYSTSRLMRDGACPLMSEPWGARNVCMSMDPGDVRKELLYVSRCKKYTCELLAADIRDSRVLFSCASCFLINVQPCVCLLFLSGFLTSLKNTSNHLDLHKRNSRLNQINIW